MSKFHSIFLVLIALQCTFADNSIGNYEDVAQISGEVRVGNRVLLLPQQMPELMAELSLKRDGLGMGMDASLVDRSGWGPSNANPLFSIGNLFRLGCAIIHINELKDSFQSELEKNQHHHGGHGGPGEGWGPVHRNDL